MFCFGSSITAHNISLMLRHRSEGLCVLLMPVNFLALNERPQYTPHHSAENIKLPVVVICSLPSLLLSLLPGCRNHHFIFARSKDRSELNTTSALLLQLCCSESQLGPVTWLLATLHLMRHRVCRRHQGARQS